MSEAWTLESKGKQINPDILQGCQKYYGIKGNSVKKGCGFYVREDIKFKLRNDPKLTFCGKYDEFQRYWIEILNKKNPNILLGIYYRHPKKSQLMFL